MEYLDKSKFGSVECISGRYELRIYPFEYLDGRRPRLPRKSSKRYTLMADTIFYFCTVFEAFGSKPNDAKYGVELIVNNGYDRLGNADLDNYCKAILDGITSTQKVWKDDRQVDELRISRITADQKESSIDLKIYSLG